MRSTSAASTESRRDFKKDIQAFDQQPVSKFEGDDDFAASVLKYNGYLSLDYRDGEIIYVKTPKADRVIALMRFDGSLWLDT